ncbi:Snf7-domain-containing protein [Tuber indicum]|nr:Snf7-domain-containing protein [Tuber indicum]
MSELLSFTLAHEQFRRARLPSLYSDFCPLRANNPSGFLANVTAWKSVLSQAAANGILGGDTLVLEIGEGLVGSLATREWGRPLALGTVVNEAVSTREFISLETFLGMRESVYYRPWVDPWKVLVWGLEVVGLKSRAVEDGKIREGKVVVLKNIEETAKTILKEISKRPSIVDRIFSTEMFLQEFPIHGKPLSETDLRVLLVFLSRDLREASVANNTIKFKPPTGELTPVSPHDTTIANLKTLITSLHTTISTLSTKISTSDAKARTAIQSSNKHAALSALKSKKIAETSLESRAKSLAQLEEVLVKIEQAADNIELVRTLEDSSKVLAGLNKRVGGVEGVDKVTDELREQMNETGEITRILGEETSAIAQVDDGEVEGEFEALLQEEERKVRMKEDEEALKRKLPKSKEEVNGELKAVTGPMEELKLKEDILVPTLVLALAPAQKEQSPEQVPAS